MSYKSSDKTRKKKDAKRSAMMQAAVRVFAQKGYHSATIRDIVQEAHVAVGTFYFYFPDKETLFIHLFEETADFLLQAVQQGIGSRNQFPLQTASAIQAYINVALFEPAVIRLLLVGGAGAVPSLEKKRISFREKLIRIWQNTLDQAQDDGFIVEQDTRLTAEGITGALDEMVLNFLARSEPDQLRNEVGAGMIAFTLRAAGYTGNEQ